MTEYDDETRARLTDRLGGDWDGGDGDTWRGEFAVSGPAGLAAAELPGGVEVDLDVTEPDRVVGVSVPGDWTPDRVVGEATRIRSSRDVVARLALADDAIDAPDVDAVTRALAGVDRALATIDLGGWFDDDETRRRARAALAAVHDRADDVLEVDQPYPVADALRRLADHLDPAHPDPTTTALAAALEDAARSRAPDPLLYGTPITEYLADLPAPAAAFAPVSPLLDLVDVATLPDGLVAEQIAVRATTPSEIEVRCTVPAAPGRWWARAHRRDGTVLAVAPFRAAGTGVLARLLVPPADRRTVTVDVTDRPGEPRPGAASRRIVDAVRAGRRAARDERAERPVEAREGWHLAADAWHDAGDRPRRRAALERADASRRRFPPMRPLLSDLPEAGPTR